MRIAGSLLALTLLAACGSGPTSSGRTGPIEYVTRATVLESPKHDPELCFAVMTSLPPQCGGPDITNWSWKKVAGEKSARGTTWGDYVVYGTYADGRFTLSRKPVDPRTTSAGKSDEDGRDFASPCPTPKGGWFPKGRTMMSEDDQQRAMKRAQQDPNFGEIWVDQRPVGKQSEKNMNDPARLILNVRVTKDVAGMEVQLRAVWGGALCVSMAKHTDAELRRITAQVDKSAGHLLLSSSWGDDGVDLDVFVDEDGRLQKEFDAKYGKGVVRVTSALRAASPKV
jgi:hypothetical protein